ncbi:MAG: GDSL-type esterase/lipase family protein, partial [Acholeplasma sp.]|nr:GDSL-type esterase/lipase family protein [Acholeplasma sp.]
MQKYHVKVITLAVLLQLIAYFFIGLKSFIFITPIIIFASLWLFAKVWINRLVKDSNKRINYITIISSVSIILCFLELIIRFSGIVAVYSEKRDGFYRSMYDDRFADYYVRGSVYPKKLESGNEYSYNRIPNNEGYSDSNWESAKSDTIYRILALGDSYTEGDGAHSDSTWVKFLERKLDNRCLEFMNAGLCGSDPIYAYHNLENNFLKYQPDLVILCINNSDINDIAISGGFERFTPEGIKFKKAPWWEPIYAASHISRLFFRMFYDYKLISYSENECEIKESIEILKSTLLKFKNLSNSNSIKFVCVIHPVKYELENGTNTLKELISFCENNGVVCIDLYDYYLRQNVDKNINQYYWEKDGHHNANGYKLMADGIYEG